MVQPREVVKGLPLRIAISTDQEGPFLFLIVMLLRHEHLAVSCDCEKRAAAPPEAKQREHVSDPVLFRPKAGSAALGMQSAVSVRPQTDSADIQPSLRGTGHFLPL